MLRYLRDPANGITVIGIAFSGLAIREILVGQPQLAIAAALVSVVADQFDGIVAKRTKNRDADIARMGKSLDGFGDLLYGAVVPATLIIAVGKDEILPVLAGMFLLFTGALRLSYFNNFGMSAGHFIGVPLSYDVPLLAIIFIAQPWMPEIVFVPVLTGLLFLLGCLHICSLQVPAPGRAMYLLIVAFSIAASFALVGQTLARSNASLLVGASI